MSLRRSMVAEDRSGRETGSCLPDRPSGLLLVNVRIEKPLRPVIALFLAAGLIAAISLAGGEMGALTVNPKNTCQGEPLVWEIRTGLRGDSRPAVEDGILFVPLAELNPAADQAAEDGADRNADNSTRTALIRAMREADGQAIWQRYFPEGVWEQSLSAGSGVLLAGGSGGRLFALEAKSGRVRWSLKLEGEINSAPAIVDGTAYVATSHVGPGITPNPYGKAWIYAVRLTDGHIIWQVNTENYGFTSPIYHNGTVYAGGGYLDEPALEEGGYTGIYALDAATGQIRWRHRSPDGFVKSMAAANNTVAFVGYTDFVFGLDSRSGRVIWTYPTGNWAPAVSASADRLFVGSANGFIHAIDPETGRAVWRHNLEGVFNYPVGAPVPHGGFLYTVTTAGDLMSIDQTSGELNWKAKIDTETRSAPTVTNSRILIHSTEGRLSAYPLQGPSGECLGTH